MISTVDKASNNFLFVYKKFFLNVLLDEYGFDKINFLPVGNVNYSPVKDKTEDIVDRHFKEMLERFCVKCSSEDCVLPSIFWIPLLHKSPFKLVLIEGARHCTTRRLSVLIIQNLLFVRDNFNKYCNAIQRNSGYNFFWSTSVNSTLEFLDKVRDIQVHNVQVYDFSTLYSNIHCTC